MNFERYLSSLSLLLFCIKAQFTHNLITIQCKSLINCPLHKYSAKSLIIFTYFLLIVRLLGMKYAKSEVVVHLFFRLIFLPCLLLTSGVHASCPNPDGCDPDPTLNPPSTPSGVAATWWYTPEVNLSWNASTGPGGYSITYGVYRSTITTTARDSTMLPSVDSRYRTPSFRKPPVLNFSIATRTFKIIP